MVGFYSENLLKKPQQKILFVPLPSVLYVREYIGRDFFISTSIFIRNTDFKKSHLTAQMKSWIPKYWA